MPWDDTLMILEDQKILEESLGNDTSKIERLMRTAKKGIAMKKITFKEGSWERYLQQECLDRDWEAALGHDVSTNDNRIATARNVIRTQKEKTITGKHHCVCCLKPIN